MSIGSSLSDMFFGPSAPEESQASKDAQAQMWKIYQQAYNVQPQWNAKKGQWEIPPGAVARYQMLLPILQAQVNAARAGQAGQGTGGAGAGLLQGMAGKGISALGEGVFNKLGGGSGVSGIVDKLWNLIGGSKSEGLTPYGPQGSSQSPYDIPPEASTEAPVSIAPASSAPNSLADEGGGVTPNTYDAGPGFSPDLPASDWQSYIDSFQAPDVGDVGFW